MHQSSWIVQGTAGIAAIDTTFLGTAAPSPPWRRWRLVELSATERAEVLARPVATPPSCRDPHPPSQPLSVMIRQLLFRRRSGSIPALRLNCRCWLMGQGDGPVLSWLDQDLVDDRRAGRRRARCWGYLFGASASNLRRCLRRAGGWASGQFATRSAGG